MDEQKARSMAAQLRKPHGEWAGQIAEFMAMGNAVLIQRTIDAMNTTDGEEILEIGMGSGAHVPTIVGNHSTVHYTGYDYSEEMVGLAASVNETLVANSIAKFIHGDAASMPFDDNSFDKILTVNTVYFWDDIVAVASEIKRVLKPEGKLILGLRPERLMKTYPMTQYGFTMYSKETVCSMLEQHGFSIDTVHEEDEPPLDVDGETFVLSSLVVTAQKKNS